MLFVILDCAFVSCEIVYLDKQDAYTDCCSDNSTYWKGYDFVERNSYDHQSERRCLGPARTRIVLAGLEQNYG